MDHQTEGYTLEKEKKVHPSYELSGVFLSKSMFSRWQAKHLYQTPPKNEASLFEWSKR